MITGKTKCIKDYLPNFIEGSMYRYEYQERIVDISAFFNVFGNLTIVPIPTKEYVKHFNTMSREDKII
jgi:hypothetical protein